jgi:hypothetical protein
MNWQKNWEISASLFFCSLTLKTGIRMPCYSLSLTSSNGVSCGAEMFVLPPYFHFLNISLKVDVKILWHFYRTKLFLTFRLKENFPMCRNVDRQICLHYSPEYESVLSQTDFLLTQPPSLHSKYCTVFRLLPVGHNRLLESKASRFLGFETLFTDTWYCTLRMEYCDLRSDS